MRNTFLIASTLTLASSALATVETTLRADTYLVKQGSGSSAKFYSVLDVYVRGNHLGDAMSSVLGHTGHPLSIRTNKATATGDIFVHGGSTGNGWLPTDDAAKSWDSFIALGNRAQGTKARTTNRAGNLVNLGSASSWVAGSDFVQMSNPGSNSIDQGTNSGWYTNKGANPYESAGALENPFARVSLYNSDWNGVHGDLYRGWDVLYTKGMMQSGSQTAATAWANRIDPTQTPLTSGMISVGGESLDFHWMIGRFAIDVTGKSAAEVITLQVQFNMVGKNGTGMESGSPSFTGTSNPIYNVNNHFAFAVPSPASGALLALAAACVRRRRPDSR